MIAWYGHVPWWAISLTLIGALAAAYALLELWDAGDRLRRIHAELKTPAPGGPATPPDAGPSPAAGTHSPPCAAAPQPAPLPGHDCGRPVFGIVIYDGECAYALNHRTGEWRLANHCGRTDFDAAEWEAKLHD